MPHFYLQNRRDGVELGDDSAVVGVGAADQRLRRIRARLRYRLIILPLECGHVFVHLQLKYEVNPMS